MKNIFLVFLLSVVLSCCETENKPDYLLSKEQMVAILIDIHILESKIQNLRIKKDSSQLLYNSFERGIFDKHKVDKKVYKKSFEYYLEGVDEMQEIYSAVVDSLNFKEKSAVPKPKLEKPETPLKIE